MKKLKLTTAFALIVLTMSFCQTGCSPNETGHYFVRQPVPELSLIEGATETQAEVFDDDSPTEVIISVDYPSVLETFVDRKSDCEIDDFIFSVEGKSASDSANKAVQNVIERLETLGIESESSTNIVASTVSATVPFGMIKEISAIEGVKDVSLCPKIRVDESVVDNETFLKELEKAEATAEEEYPESVVNANKIYELKETKGGEGQLIAIVDSGLFINHEAFSVEPDIETAKVKGQGYLTEEMKAKLKGGANINYYLNQKVVYRYDYAEKDNNVNPGLSTTDQHGTHVAGIAAGNNGKDFFGVAPNAQLAIFKAFRNNEDLADFNVLLSAIEDTLIIGADVINMSLGIDAGTPQGDLYYEVINNIVAAGITVVAAGGNSDKSTANDRSTNGLAKSDNPDYSIVSTPGAIKGAFMVASSGTERDPYLVSSFSAWGPGNDLAIKPEISAPGEQVRSSVGPTNSNYTYFRGTSMSSPNVAGIVAVMRAELSERTSLKGYELSETVINYLMSNAFVMTDGNGVPLSPRSQGAGFADPVKALDAPAYLSAHDSTRAKLELGDDEARTGKYTMNFEIHNVSDKTLEYTVSQKTITEKYRNGLCAAEPHLLDPRFSVISVENGKLDGNTVSVEGNSVASVTVSIELTETDVDYVEQYEAGIYVEGFIFLDSADSKLNIPFLAYYGDWGEPQTLDIFEGTGGEVTYAALTLSAQNSEGSNVKLGAYSYAGGSQFDVDYAALTLGKGLTGFGTVGSVVPVRSFKTLKVTVTDYDTGEELFRSENLCDASAKAIRSQYGVLMNSVGNVDINLSLEDMGGEKVFANNGKYNFNLVPIGFDNEDATPSSKVFYVDCEAPRILSASKDGNELKIVLRDNHYLQALRFYYKLGGEYKALESSFTNIISSTLGGEREFSKDVSAFDETLASSDDGKLYVYVVDFARNASWYSFDVSEDGAFSSADEVPPQKSDTEYDKDLENNCFYDTDGVLYKALPQGLSLIDYPSTLTLDSYKVLDGTVRIERGAFVNPSLKKVVIPESVKRLGDDAFLACPALDTVIYLGNARPVTETGGDAIYENFAQDFENGSLLYSASEIEDLLEEWTLDAYSFVHYEYYVLELSYSSLSSLDKATIANAEKTLSEMAQFAAVREEYRNLAAESAMRAGSPEN